MVLAAKCPVLATSMNMGDHIWFDERHHAGGLTQPGDPVQAGEAANAVNPQGEPVPGPGVPISPQPAMRILQNFLKNHPVAPNKPLITKKK